MKIFVFVCKGKAFPRIVQELSRKNVLFLPENSIFVSLSTLIL